MQQKWEAHKASAEKAESLGRLGQAEAYWYAALEEAEAEFSMTDPRMTSTLESLSENLFRQSKYFMAIPVVTKTLEIFEESLGPNHADVGILLNNLGMLHHLQTNYVEAEKLYQRAMTVLSKALGSGHPEMANLLANYSDLLTHTHREPEAEHMRLMLRGLNTGRWTRSVVHEAYRPPEPETEQCTQQLGLDYQQKASEIRLKQVQERIKNAALKQQEAAAAHAESNAATQTRSQSTAPRTAQSVGAPAQTAAANQSVASRQAAQQAAQERAEALEAEQEKAAAWAAAEQAALAQAAAAEVAAAQAAATRAALEHAEALAAAEAEQAAAARRAQVPLDQQISEQFITGKRAPLERRFISEKLPPAESPFDQLAAALPQPVIPQFEPLIDPEQEQLPPGIARLLATRLQKKDNQ